MKYQEEIVDAVNWKMIRWKAHQDPRFVEGTPEWYYETYLKEEYQDYLKRKKNENTSNSPTNENGISNDSKTISRR